MSNSTVNRFGLVFLISTVLVAACSPAPLAEKLDSAKGALEQRGASAPAPGQAAPQIAPSAGGARPATAAIQGSPNASQAPLPNVLDRMIIRTADVKLSVPDVRQAVTQVEQIATLVGGMVFASSFSASQQQDVASVTLRVPPDQETFQQVLDRLAAMEGAKVTDKNIGSTDVTEEYTDLDAQLRNLQATETRLLALLDKATRLEDVLTLERELSSVRNNIERIQGRKQLLQRRADLATIVVTLRQVAAGKNEAGEGWNPLTIASKAIAALVMATQGIATVLIWLVVWSPVYALPIYVLWLLRRRLQQPRTAT